MFDPNINVKEKLKSLNFNFKFFNIAFDNEKKIKKLYLNTAFPASGTSLLPITANSRGYNFSRKVFFLKKKDIFSMVNVQTQTLDSFIKKNHIKKIDILKLGTEDNELNFFRRIEDFENN